VASDAAAEAPYDSAADKAAADARPALDALGFDGEWANVIHSDSQDRIDVVATLADGSTIVAGDVGGNGTFLGDPMPIAGFLLRLRADGTLVWKRTGFQAWANAIAPLADGTFVVVGRMLGSSVVFGAGEPHETTLVNPEGAGYVPFLACFRNDGLLAWARVAGSGDIYIERLATNSDGSLLAAGSFTRTVQLAQGTPQATQLIAVGLRDVFLARYGATGELAWAKPIGGPGNESSGGLATFANGSAAFAGAFEGTVIFGKGEAKETSLTSPSGATTFLARFAADGSLDRVAAPGLPWPYTQNVRIAALPDGSLYLAAAWGGTITLVPGGPSLTSVGYETGFLARISADGTFAWVRPLVSGGANDLNFSWVLTTLSSGDAVVGGAFVGAVTFGAGSATQTMVASGKKDAYLARYSSAGDFFSAVQIGGTDHDLVTAVAAADSGVVAGFYFGALENDAWTGTGYSSSVTIRPGTSNARTLQGQFHDALIARIVF
ncbi:MAG TPA: hypothetical protein VF518_10795, partial [Polyangia bacterium]